MNFQAKESNNEKENNNTNMSPSQVTPASKNIIYEPMYHTSQTKRPMISFTDVSPYNLNIQNIQDSNVLSLNISKQQEKYDSIKKYCNKKNDPESYPLISYENFLIIDGLCDKNIGEFEDYKNFLLNKNASIELYSKFCTLLMNRFILSKQNNSLNKYPKVVYQIIFDITNIYNYLSPDIVSDAKQSNMFMGLINYQNKWNILAINQNNNFCNYFMFNKNMDKEILLTLMKTVTQTIFPYHNFNFSVSDYSDLNESNKTILPFIIMDFFSRYKSNLPIDDEDYYYQTILILSEIMTNNLITK